MSESQERTLPEEMDAMRVSELKVPFPPEERPSTNVSVGLVVILSLAVTVGIFAAVYPFKGTFTRDLIMGRVEISYERVTFQGLTLWMWQMSFFTCLLKFFKARKEMKLVRADLIPRDLDMRDITALMEVHAGIMAHPKLPESLVLTRMGRILAMWINTEDTERTLSYAKMESEMDIYISDSSYRANRLYIWAMPLLGFVGTVFGVSAGIGGFAEFLRGQVTSEEIKVQVGLITEGLAVAFYCTLLGLMTAGIAAFPSLAAEKREEELMGELDQYIEDRLISRLPSVRKVEFPKAEFTAMRENLERLNIDITGDQLITAIKEIKIDFPMDELTTALSKIKFELPIDDLTKALQGIKFNLPMDELTEALQNIKFNLPMEDFVSGIKDGLQDLRLNVIMPMEDLSRAIDQGFRRLPDPDNYVTVFSRAIADASTLVTQKNEEFARGYEQRISELSTSIVGRLDGVANKVQSGSSEVSSQINQQAAALVGEFQSAIQRINESANEYSHRVDATSKALGEQVKRVMDIAEEIDKLLHASKAMESALMKINAAEEFGQTLASIRSHLSTNDAFVQRMTKPRKIVLQEESASV